MGPEVAKQKGIDVKPRISSSWFLPTGVAISIVLFLALRRYSDASMFSATSARGPFVIGGAMFCLVALVNAHSSDGKKSLVRLLGNDDWGEHYFRASFLTAFFVMSTLYAFVTDDSFNFGSEYGYEVAFAVGILAAMFSMFSGKLLWQLFSRVLGAGHDEIKTIADQVALIGPRVEALGGWKDLKDTLLVAYTKLGAVRAGAGCLTFVVSLDTKILDPKKALPTTLLFMNNQVDWARGYNRTRSTTVTSEPDWQSLFENALEELWTCVRVRQHAKNGQPANTTFDGATAIAVTNRPPFFRAIRLFIGTKRELAEQADVIRSFVSVLGHHLDGGNPVLSVWLDEDAWMGMPDRDPYKLLCFHYDQSRWNLSRKRKYKSYPCDPAKLAGIKAIYDAKKSKCAYDFLEAIKKVAPNVSLHAKKDPDFLVIGNSYLTGYSREEHNHRHDDRDKKKGLEFHDGEDEAICALLYVLVLSCHSKARLLEPIVEELLTVGVSDEHEESRLEKRMAHLDELLK